MRNLVDILDKNIGMNCLITKCRDIKNYIIGPKHYFYKTAVFFTAGILYSSEFLMGVKTGILDIGITAPIGCLLLYYFSSPVKEDNSSYEDVCLDKPIAASITVPIMEELLFRVGLQTVVKYCINSESSIIHVIITALIFGVTHLTNSHTATKEQAVASSISGLLYGLLFEYYGILASIGAHTINNTILISIQLMIPTLKKYIEDERIRLLKLKSDSKLESESI